MLTSLTLRVKENEFICLVGPSGCGKTTLLRIIADLVTPDNGCVRIQTDPGDRRPRSAMVFQDHGLFPWMSALDNVAFALETQGMARRERRERARDFLVRLGLAPFAESYPHELSTGMRQRVGIARAFLADPQVLLMDEPLSSLDAQTRLLLEEELLQLWTSSPKTVIYVTHDIEEAVALGDRVVVLTGRPATIRAEITVPLGRPRRVEAGTSPAAAQIKWQIWKMIESEARQQLEADR